MFRPKYVTLPLRIGPEDGSNEKYAPLCSILFTFAKKSPFHVVTPLVHALLLFCNSIVVLPQLRVQGDT